MNSHLLVDDLMFLSWDAPGYGCLQWLFNPVLCPSPCSIASSLLPQQILHSVSEAGYVMNVKGNCSRFRRLPGVWRWVWLDVAWLIKTQKPRDRYWGLTWRSEKQSNQALTSTSVWNGVPASRNLRMRLCLSAVSSPSLGLGLKACINTAWFLWQTSVD